MLRKKTNKSEGQTTKLVYLSKAEKRDIELVASELDMTACAFIRKEMKMAVKLHRMKQTKYVEYMRRLEKAFDPLNKEKQEQRELEELLQQSKEFDDLQNPEPYED